MSDAYKNSGVDLEAGYESVNRIKKHIKRTSNLGVMGNIGAFGGMFDLSKYNVKNPVLVSGTDGVGTKLLIAQQLNKHDTIGIDLVAMCVNDIVTVGAKPLYFLDYIAVSKNNPVMIEEIVKGISEGCIEAGCALVGGETAEMPDLYSKDHYDLAGYTTGVVDKEKIIDKELVTSNDLLIGLPSSGIHSNGYSLVRKVFFKDNNYHVNDYIESLGTTLGDELLKPTKIYVEDVLSVIDDVVSLAHITGGGFIENIPRCLPSELGVLINKDSLPKLPVFDLIMEIGNIKEEEMYNVFNMGIGMVLVVKKESKDTVLQKLPHALVIGEVVNTNGVVIK